MFNTPTPEQSPQERRENKDILFGMALGFFGVPAVACIVTVIILAIRAIYSGA